MITDKSISEPIIFTKSGLDIGLNPQENLCVRAFHLLRSEYSQVPPVRMHLHKVIPMGAGLGGGSSDAAFTLELLNQKYQLGISDEELKEFALELGSDCPFFIDNKPCIATGRGEKMKQVSIDLNKFKIVLVYPGIHISTPWAFGAIEPNANHTSIEQVISGPVSTWKENLVNDFEKPVFSQYPVVAAIKETLYANGAIFASMSGSGSAVYGLFETLPLLDGVFDKSFQVFTF